MKTLRVRLTLTEEMLGTSSSNPEIHKEFIASKAPDAKSAEEEVAAIGVDAAVEKSMTVFPKCKVGELAADQRALHKGTDLSCAVPIMWDYQIKGFFKDTCSALSRVPDTRSNKLKAFRKVINGLVFTGPRRILLELPDGAKLGNCQRPLRAQTAQGERIALANSETVPVGTALEFDIKLLDDGLEKVVRDWLDYGELQGLGQWRNSGKGRFTWAEVK